MTKNEILRLSHVRVGSPEQDQQPMTIDFLEGLIFGFAAGVAICTAIMLVAARRLERKGI